MKKRKTATKRQANAAAAAKPSARTANADAKTVLDTRFISYSTPLEIARGWARGNGAENRKQALQLLEGLFEQYPHAIEIAQELVLAYLESNQDRQAQDLLDEIQLLSRNPNEEVLARSGRVFRDMGDQFVTYPMYTGPPEVKIGGDVEEPTQALRYYRLALAQYAQSYEIRRGHYPGVNVATLNLLTAAFSHDSGEREAKRQTCKSVAGELLDRKHLWPNEHDDDVVWHAASTGEIHLLREQWALSEQWYRNAQHNKKCQSFHRISMLKQVIRITYCYKRLGVTSLGAFDDLTNVFPPDPSD